MSYVTASDNRLMIETLFILSIYRQYGVLQMPDSIPNLDTNILFFIQAHCKSPVLDRIMVFLTTLGNAGLIWIAIAIVLLSYKRYRKCGIYLLCVLPIASILCDEVLKIIFRRIRPCNIYRQVPLLIGRHHSYSFPSGHTMVSFAAATVLFYYNRYLGIAGYILASLIAFSRIYLFVHYPSDILGGILFGVLSSALIIYGLNQVSSAKLSDRKRLILTKHDSQSRHKI